MALLTKPNIQKIWASGGDIVEPSDLKKQQGWVPEVPPHQFENWIQNRQDQYLAHINQRGIPAWDALTEYEAGGLSYVQGTDGKIYKSVAASGPSTVAQNPVTDGSDTYWTIAFADVGAFLTQTAADSRYTQRSNNLSDLTNTADARTNLSVYSIAEVDAAITAIPNFLDSTRIDVASAGTVNLTTSAPNTRNIRLTGSATVNQFTVVSGKRYLVQVGGNLTIANNANIVTGTGANLSLADGDAFELISTAANVVSVSLLRQRSVISREYTSSPQTVTNGGQLVLSHGLGSSPKIITAEVVFVAAQANYSIGDVVPINISVDFDDTATTYGIGLRKTATQIIVRFGANGIGVADNNTGLSAVITAANINLIIRAFV